MIDNYDYFIALAESGSISKAAERLYITHQALSLYIKNLEKKYHVIFFERSPKLVLTEYGRIYLNAAREMQFIEQNLNNQISAVDEDERGVIRFATTEGRYRLLIPYLVSEFRRMYPHVELETHYGTTVGLRENILENNMDYALLNESVRRHNSLEIEEVLAERMNMVISDDMLREYFSDMYPGCISRFSEGVDLAEFEQVPFALAKKNKNSRIKLDRYLEEYHHNLNVRMELMQSDVHYMLTAENYAASFCWDMYVPSIHRLNRSREYSHLYIFPLQGHDITNKLMLVSRKGRVMREYEKEFCRLLRRTCKEFEDPQLNIV